MSAPFRYGANLLAGGTTLSATIAATAGITADLDTATSGYLIAAIAADAAVSADLQIAETPTAQPVVIFIE